MEKVENLLQQRSVGALVMLIPCCFRLEHLSGYSETIASGFLFFWSTCFEMQSSMNPSLGVVLMVSVVNHHHDTSHLHQLRSCQVCHQVSQSFLHGREGWAFPGSK